ncbi:MAG: DUF2235 domain-containing protein [Desulfuromonadales bacterium]
MTSRWARDSRNWGQPDHLGRWDDPWQPRKFDLYGFDEEGFDAFGRDRFGRTSTQRDPWFDDTLSDPTPWRGIAIETLPIQLTRQLHPHYRDWIVIDPEKARYQRLGENTRLFVEGKKGWEPVDSFSSLRIGQKHYAVTRRLTRRTFGGGGSFGSSTSCLNFSYAEPPAPPVSFAPITDTGAVARHSLDVEILPGVQAAEGRLILSGSQNYHIQRAVSAATAGIQSTRFGNLAEKGSYTLKAAWGANKKTLFESVPFDILVAPGTLRGLLSPDVDEGARLYLLDHRLRGERPLLRAGWEAPQFGIFADGTGNNGHNDMASETKAPTNVTKLHDLYPHIDGGLVNRYYLDGIGTRTGEEDGFFNLLDQGIAYSFGKLVRDAIERMRIFFQRLPLATFGYVDLFGFSRGSAIARALVNCIHHLNDTDPAYWGGLRVVVRFVGIFDTVGSVGLPGNNINDNPISNAGMPCPINLDLHPQAARAVYHLTAQDEQRRNFPLSSLRSADGSLPTHFVEEAMPGAHADVGGGYRSGEELLYLPSQQFTWLRPEERDRQMAQTLTAYRQQYPVPGLEIEARIQWEGVHQPPWRRSIVSFCGRRLVRDELAHVALERMHAAALNHGVPLLPLAKLPSKNHAYRVPVELSAMVKQAERAGPGSAPYDALYRDYIHHSHRYRSGGEGGEGLANQINAHDSNPGGRTVFANEPERGNYQKDPWQEASQNQQGVCI